ncbi:MAG: hypothetical protein JWQ22_2329 [Devosia sp.]|nr:hypothetical protein [Devosia sp.]
MPKRSPRSDFGTFVLHWVLVILVTVQIGTGLRIASHEPSLGWLANLDFVLPRENLWYWHLVGALGFTAVFVSYITYVLVARLGQRSRLDHSRLASLWRGGSARWTTFGVLVLWVGFGAFAAEIISGSLLYLGKAGWAISVHRHAVWFCIVFPFAHVLCHYLAGGIDQVLRILRPTRLVIPSAPPDILTMLAEHVQFVDTLKQGHQPTLDDFAVISESKRETARKPLITSVIVGASVVALGLVAQNQTSQTLDVPLLENLGRFDAPVINGDVSDAVWAMAPSIGLLTSQGANFAPERQSWIEIKAVRDQTKIYISLIWEDQTRSLRHLPLVKGPDGWLIVRSVTPESREEIFYEDQFSMLISPPTVPIIGSAVHLSPKPLRGYPPSSTGRGMHYLENDAVSDLWVWRASHGGPSAMVEDARFGNPVAPTPGQLSGAEHYRGGYAPDEGPSCFIVNHALSKNPENPALVPLRLPKDISWVAPREDDSHVSADFSDPDDARYWMTDDESEPYSLALDQQFPENSVIPGIIMTCVPSGGRADVFGHARWAAGRWTLELMRALNTNSTQDVPIASGSLVWLAAFDHAATRHTRHVRPIELHLP